MTMRNGHPRKTRAPIIVIIPKRKRIMGEEPAVERYSPVAMEIMKAPAIRPAISGRIYCTMGAVCSLAAPAMSRIKQAIQNAIFPGFPIIASHTATAPSRPPHTSSPFFELSVSFISFPPNVILKKE